MPTWTRMFVLAQVTVAELATGVIYYRIYQPELVPLATQTHDGPYTQVVNVTSNIVPTLLLVIWFAVAVWAIAGGVQEEKARGRVR